MPGRSRYGSPVKNYDRRVWVLAALLSALAGYVGAIGFIALNGFFVSFMSGNPTHLGVGLAQASTPAAVALSLVGTFVVGVVAGSLTGHVAKGHRRTAVLVLVAVLLALAAGMGSLDHTKGAVALMVVAMGAENAVFERDGEVYIGLTYMTGRLVKLGQRLAMALVGGNRFAWVSYLLLWAGRRSLCRRPRLTRHWALLGCGPRRPSRRSSRPSRRARRQLSAGDDKQLDRRSVRLHRGGHDRISCRDNGLGRDATLEVV